MPKSVVESSMEAQVMTIRRSPSATVALSHTDEYLLDEIKRGTKIWMLTDFGRNFISEQMRPAGCSSVRENSRRRKEKTPLEGYLTNSMYDSTQAQAPATDLDGG